MAAGAHYGWRPASFPWKPLATARGGGGGRVALPAEAALHAVVCTACGDGDDSGGNDILLCDGAECSTAMHMRCLQPPLKAVPKGKWYCPECAAERKELRVAYINRIYEAEKRQVHDEFEVRLHARFFLRGHAISR